MLFMWFLLNFSQWLYPRSSIANRTRAELDLPESTRAQQRGRVLLSSISWLQVVQLKAVEMTWPTVCQWTRWDMNDNTWRANVSLFWRNSGFSGTMG